MQQRGELIAVAEIWVALQKDDSATSNFFNGRQGPRRSDSTRRAFS